MFEGKERRRESVWNLIWVINRVFIRGTCEVEVDKYSLDGLSFPHHISGLRSRCRMPFRKSDLCTGNDLVSDWSSAVTKEIPSKIERFT